MQRDSRRVLGEYLVIAAQTGDRAASGQLARLWQPALLRHALRLTGETELARDTLQDAWIDILRGLGGLSDAAAFPAWAYRIVTRNAEALADRGPLARALATLPVEQRTAMALFYIDDFTVAEIAVALSVPAGTIKTRLMHARRKMRAALELPRLQSQDTGGRDDRK